MLDISAISKPFATNSLQTRNWLSHILPMKNQGLCIQAIDISPISTTMLLFLEHGWSSGTVDFAKCKADIRSEGYVSLCHTSKVSPWALKSAHWVSIYRNNYQWWHYWSKMIYLSLPGNDSRQHPNLLECEIPLKSQGQQWREATTWYNSSFITFLTKCDYNANHNISSKYSTNCTECKAA